MRLINHNSEMGPSNPGFSPTVLLFLHCQTKWIFYGPFWAWALLLKTKHLLPGWDTWPSSAASPHFSTSSAPPGWRRAGPGGRTSTVSDKKVKQRNRTSPSFICPSSRPHLFIIRHQVRLKLPLGPIFGQLVVGDLSQVKVGHLGRGSLHPPAGRPLRVGLHLSFLVLLFIVLQRHLWRRVAWRRKYHPSVQTHYVTLCSSVARVLSVSVRCVRLGAATHRRVLWSQVILQTRFGLVGFPAVGAVEQQLLQLGLLLPTLPHVVHVSHDAAERCAAALTGKGRD